MRVFIITILAMACGIANISAGVVLITYSMVRASDVLLLLFPIGVANVVSVYLVVHGATELIHDRKKEKINES